MNYKYNNYVAVLVILLTDALKASVNLRNDIGGSDWESEDRVNLSKTGCGKVKLKLDKGERIINGDVTSFGEYPWQVAFISNASTNMENGVLCGGALLNDRWIITAAHCFYHENFKDYKARLGEYDFSSETEPLRHVDRALALLFDHPEFDYSTFMNDVALVKMKERVAFQTNIQPICLYAKNDTLVRALPKASGWGKIFENGRHPFILRDVILPVLRNKECEKFFINIDKRTPLPKTFICAGYRYGKLDTCQGDSGGPLQLQLSDGQWALIGITSWGYGCGRFSSPGLSTRVSAVLPWIKKTLGENV